MRYSEAIEMLRWDYIVLEDVLNMKNIVNNALDRKIGSQEDREQNIKPKTPRHQDKANIAIASIENFECVWGVILKISQN